MSGTSPFHDGELQVQQRAGEAAQAQRIGRGITDSLPPGAAAFLAEQRLAAVASMASDGSIWASVLVGAPGFVVAPDARSAEVDLRRVVRDADDPLFRNLQDDARIGLLMIDLATRRRLRVNGQAQLQDSLLRVAIAEAYGNCPKYIQRRLAVHPETAGFALQSGHGNALGDAQRQLLAGADTLFVASGTAQGGLDASHRGGAPGFARWVTDDTLRVSDYRGNGMFNTLGNLLAYPRAGVMVLDFSSARTLQLVGRARLLWDSPHETAGGTGRAWELVVERWREAQLPPGLAWEFAGASPHNPPLGDESPRR